MDKKYTIKDIAELSGVSKGTVDRVLHDRGKVSEKALKSVEKVLKEIDYQPNPMARSLKNNKIYTICVILPDPEQDAYWIPAVKGINKASEEFKRFGIHVTKFYYNSIDKSSFVQKSNKALEASPDVLLMAPLFQKEALMLFEKCQEKNILIALFNNFINAFITKTFIGQDLFQSGRVAASLIHKMIKDQSDIAVLHIDEEAHMKLKEDGFKAFLKEKKGTYNTKTLSLTTTDQTKFKNKCIEFVKQSTALSAIFVTNSKSYLLIEAIGELAENIVVVGYDLLEENITFLQNGSIDFLIHQKPERQAYLGVGYLAEHFLFGKDIPKENLLPIDIITTENVKYYLD